MELKAKIEKHEGIDACSLKISQHLVLAQALQNCQIAQALVLHSHFHIVIGLLHLMALPIEPQSADQAYSNHGH